MKLQTYSDQNEALRSLSIFLAKKIQQRHAPFHLALSDGSYTEKLFNLWREEFKQTIPWDLIRFYWADEFCTDPHDGENNYRQAYELLFRPLNIPKDHIHRIHGERDAETEAAHYSDMIRWELPGYSCLPHFDAIILDMGEDGHIASIYPGSEHLLTDERCYAVIQNPLCDHKKISMTGQLILSGKNILIPVIEKSQANILRQAIHEINQPTLPVSYILAHAKEAIIYTNISISME